MKEIDETKYPDKLYLNFWEMELADTGEYDYGWTADEEELLKKHNDNVEYVRADIIPQWHDAIKGLPPQVDEGYSDWVVATTGSDYFIALLKYKSNGTTEWLIPNESEYADSIIAWMEFPEYKPQK